VGHIMAKCQFYGCHFTVNIIVNLDKNRLFNV